MEIPANSSQNKLALPSQIELGKYRILHTLGQGGFGITYQAEDIATGEKVVIKENLPTFCAYRNSTLNVAPTNPDDELQEYNKLLTRFVEEARLLAQLDHPNIVKVLGAFEALGTAYYVMPWVGGKELYKAAPAAADITEEWLRPILSTLLGALGYLHSLNIYHRDVKPSNILLTDNGTPILIDFGTARAIISDRSATMVGTPGYSPIEQITTHGKRGPWTDIYSLGATCYRLIIGKHPNESGERLAEDEDPLRPLSTMAELFGRFSPAFLATIDKALAVRAKERWQTADAWLTALPVPVPLPNDTEPTLPKVDTTPIAMNQQAKSTAATDVQKKEKRIAAIKKWFPVAIWLFGSVGLFSAWLTAPIPFLLILGSIFYVTFPLKWLLGSVSRGKAFLCICRNVAVLYILAVILSYTDLTNDALRRSTYKSYLFSSHVLLSLPGTNVNAKDSYFDLTSLHRAAYEGNSDMVRLLLNAPGIDVNVADQHGNTPLCLAASQGKVECVRLLISAPNIDINAMNKFRCTPLTCAESKGHKECARLIGTKGGTH